MDNLEGFYKEFPHMKGKDVQNYKSAAANVDMLNGIGNKNPECVNCNDCCSMVAEITHSEYKEIIRYIDVNPQIKKFIYKRINENIYMVNKYNVLNNLCLFTNSNKQCEIYPFRPYVCRSFHCDLRLEQKKEIIRHDKRSKTMLDLFLAYSKEYLPRPAYNKFRVMHRLAYDQYMNNSIHKLKESLL